MFRRLYVMDQQARMWKSLACLVVAMTGTAALLDWIDPSGLPLTASPLSKPRIAGLAQAAVTDGVVIRPNRWQEIEIAPGPAGLGSGEQPAAFLLAVHAPKANYHFLVREDGRPWRDVAWSFQRSATGASARLQQAASSVIIRVDAVGCVLMHREPTTCRKVHPTHAQWLCVEALIATLNDRIRPDSTPLPVGLQPAAHS